MFLLILILNLSPLLLCKSDEGGSSASKSKSEEDDSSSGGASSIEVLNRKGTDSGLDDSSGASVAEGLNRKGTESGLDDSSESESDIDDDIDDEEGIIIKQNHPRHCRCGEAIRGEISRHVDIQDLAQAITTTTTTARPEYGQRFVSVRALDDRVFLPNYKAETGMLGPRYKPYQPNPRPWLVVIEVVMRKTEQKIHCTGAVLAPRWVISSRSCICGDKFGCNLKAAQKLIVDFDMLVYPAANYQRPASDRKSVNVTEAKLHARNLTHSDIVLLKLQQPLDFREGVMPICLPQDDFKEDDNLDVYISGFNFHFHNRVKPEEKCRTVAGPQKWRACRFPFLQKLNNKIQSFSSCSSNPPPSHPECHELARTMNWTKGVPITASLVKILKNVSQEEGWKKKYPGLKGDMIELECQGEYQGGIVGWCGTCLLSKGPGESGYCGEGAARKETDPNYYAEQARPTAWGGWGYCDSLCNKGRALGWQGELKMLEVLRKVSSHKECKDFLRNRGLKTQLCLYQEQDLRNRLVFTMLGPGKFRQDRQTQNLLELSPIKSQPSVGDAGAPVFRLIPKKDLGAKGGPTERAVLVGILSTNQYESLDQGRGTGISQQVISRIVPVLDWIKSWIDDEDEHRCLKNQA